MDKILKCPSAETCYIYKVYIAYTKIDNTCVIKDSTIENRDFYTCKAVEFVKKLAGQGKLPEPVAKKVEYLYDCFLIHQANKLVTRRRPDG
jgi:hypothetical protein